ncbi:AIPR family protein [Chitinophaga ginsengisoli]|uniref:AIPR protein n=1 Tax=Chitinophaga ginsengisoli TaxID=363837 RepID=A0A2P8GLN4_9BACT|nr:AIPR family protein [Chitinophaga ginsengisoli]PSL34882.1 AIPR protein [Chitinophaga ginsengisoli]
MTLNELISFSGTLISNITSEDNNINRKALLDYVLPALSQSRLTDSDEMSESFFQREKEKVEIDGYMINETQERLQLFLSDLVLPEGDLLIARKEYYTSLFAKASNFFIKAVKHQFENVQSSDPAAVIIKSLETPEFQDQIDVVEIFLISNTISVERRGNLSLRNVSFPDETIQVSYTLKKEKKSKSFKLKYQLINLNRIYSYEMAKGNPEPIVINFDPGLPALRATNNTNVFESYLAVIPATLLVKFYHDYSSRLLERNVRSFLQFKGVNKQIKETIALEPEKFIAFNNGLTITATDVTLDKVNGLVSIKSLTDFQIVNGGQTTASIYFTSKEGKDVSKVMVTAKINIVKSDEDEVMDDVISKISKFSNSQNRVSTVDLNSRSVHLVKIKNLSESITDPAGNKWFFERIRGEFNTLLKINHKRRSEIEKSYPKQKRLSKEQVAKYYVAWGVTPYLVRKGGEKVFRDFMTFIQQDEKEKPRTPDSLGRPFYEDLIAKAIMFKEFEQIYGSGPNAVGQIRSSVVPYALSLLYVLTSSNGTNMFDLGTIWHNQKLPDDLRKFSKTLLKLTHEWCKEYSKSDDVGEYAKKEELWNTILNSTEFTAFSKEPATIKQLEKYKLTAKDYKKRYMVDTTSGIFSAS